MKMVLHVGSDRISGGNTGQVGQNYFSFVVPWHFPHHKFLISLADWLPKGLLFGSVNKFNFPSAKAGLLLINCLFAGYTTFSTFSNDGLMLIRNTLIEKCINLGNFKSANSKND